VLGEIRLDIKLREEHAPISELQHALEKIYEGKKYSYPSTWYKNESLLDRLYGLVTKLIECGDGTVVRIEKKDSRFKIIFDPPFSNNYLLEDVIDKIEQEALEELLEYLATHYQDYVRKSEGQAYVLSDILKLREIPPQAAAPQQTTAAAPQQTTAAAPQQTTAAAPQQTTAAAPQQTTTAAPQQTTAAAPPSPAEVPPTPTTDIVKQQKDFVAEYIIFRYTLVTYASLYNRFGKKFTDVILDETNFSVHRHLIYKMVNEINSIDISILELDSLIRAFESLTWIPPQAVAREDLEKFTVRMTQTRIKLLTSFISLAKEILTSREPQILTEDPPKRIIEAFHESEKLLKTPSRQPIIQYILLSKRRKNTIERMLIIIGYDLELNLEYGFIKDIWNTIQKEYIQVTLYPVMLKTKSIEMGSENAESLSKLFDFANGRIYYDELTRDRRLYEYCAGLFSNLILWHYDLKLPDSEKSNVNALFNWAINLSKLQLYEESKKYYDMITLKDSNHTGAWYNKGNVLFRLGKYDDAIQCYERISNSDNFGGYVEYNKGSCYVKTLRYDDARSNYDISVNVEPSFIEAWISKGRISVASGNYEEARIYFENALKIDENCTEALNGKGVMFAKMGNYEEARIYFENALKIDENNEIVLINKGILFSNYYIFGFSSQENQYEIIDNKFKWRKDWPSKEVDYSECMINIVRVLENGKTRIMIRRKEDVESEYIKAVRGHKEAVQLRSMLAIDVTTIEPLKVDPPELKTRRKISFSLDGKYHIWQNIGINKDTGDKIVNSTEIYVLYKYLKQFVDRLQYKPDDKIFKSNEISVIPKETKIVPVIYQPVVDKSKAFIREIHCKDQKDSTEAADIEVSLVFNTDALRSFKTSDRVRRKVKRIVGTMTLEVETFTLHVDKENLENSYVIFQGNYSGDSGIEEDAVRFDNEPDPPQRKIKYYFQDYNHPIIFINTFNHTMAGDDNNINMWKWEYIPWLQNSPVYLGKKSKAEVIDEYQTV